MSHDLNCINENLLGNSLQQKPAKYRNQATD